MKCAKCAVQFRGNNFVCSQFQKKANFDTGPTRDLADWKGNPFRLLTLTLNTDLLDLNLQLHSPSAVHA